MAEKGFAQLVLNAALNPAFRAALAKDPEAVIKEHGYTVTSEQIEGLKELRLEEWDTITVKELNERLQASLPTRTGFTPIEPAPIEV